MLGNKRFIQTIRFRNLLSFGPESEEIELKSLNVLIGPNASGKSNFIEALNVLKNTPNDIAKPIRQGGGIQEYLWKGRKGTPDDAEINVILDYGSSSSISLRHVLRFSIYEQRFYLEYESIEEALENVNVDENINPIITYEDGGIFYRNEYGEVFWPANSNLSRQEQIKEFKKRSGEFNTKQPIISQLRDPKGYPEITYLVDKYPRIRIYGDWYLGEVSAPRKSQATDLIGDFLEDGTTGEIADNLALVVNDLQNRSNCWEPILERFKNFHPNTEKITPRVIGNTVLLMLHEKGLKETIPATRWSDGMLRYLALLTILCHPDPPPLICIEEPELGMHPDILSDIAELLVEASHRTQLIVTTHSDILVSALTEVPESVLVCERDEGGTSMRRLQKEKLQEWLKKYSLGE